jgi:DNA-binding winged helix-turn-helix (wHTH) protein
VFPAPAAGRNKTMRVRLGDFVLDTGTRQLLRGGADVHVSPKAFELLTALVEARPRALSKSEIHERLWPATFVSETNLAALVTEIRSVLQDDARAPRFVRTLFGYGYAFSGEAVEVEGAAAVARRAPTFWVVLDNRPLALSEGENVLGRDPNATTLWLDSSTVSRQHARIIVDGSTASIEDNHSKNGTFVNGEPLNGRRLLADGDRIGLGSLTLTFLVRTEHGAETETQ